MSFTLFSFNLFSQQCLITDVCMKDLDTLAEWFHTLDKLECDMRHARALKALWSSFWWPGMQWCREILVRLYEVDFQYVPEFVKTKIGYLEKALRSTLICENGGARLRLRERQHVSKRMAKVEQWHTLLESPLLEDFGRKPTPVTPTAEACRPKKIDENIFAAKTWEHSMGSEFDRLGKIATWPSVTHETRMLAFTSLAAYLGVGGDWQRHAGSWRGLLAVPNHFVYRLLVWKTLLLALDHIACQMPQTRDSQLIICRIDH